MPPISRCALRIGAPGRKSGTQAAEGIVGRNMSIATAGLAHGVGLLGQDFVHG